MMALPKFFESQILERPVLLNPSSKVKHKETDKERLARLKLIEKDLSKSNAYEILGVKEGSTFQEIENAFVIIKQELSLELFQRSKEETPLEELILKIINATFREFQKLEQLIESLKNENYPEELKERIQKIYSQKDSYPTAKIQLIEEEIYTHHELLSLITSINDDQNYSDTLKQKVADINQTAAPLATKIQEIKSECTEEEQGAIQATITICQQLARLFPEIEASSYPNANSISDFSSACTAKQKLNDFFQDQQQNFSTEPYQSNAVFQAQLNTYQSNPSFEGGLELLQKAKEIKIEMMLKFIKKNFNHAPVGQCPQTNSKYQEIKEFYDATLTRKTQADNKPIDDAKKRLEKYINRIKSHKKEGGEDIDFSHGFWFNKESRALSRKMNFIIACKLLNDLQRESPNLDTFTKIQEYKKKIIAKLDPNHQSRLDSSEHISSSELQDIVEEVKLSKK